MGWRWPMRPFGTPNALALTADLFAAGARSINATAKMDLKLQPLQAALQNSTSNNHGLGFSPQKPERRAIERDEESIQRWVRYTVPHIKKKPKD